MSVEVHLECIEPNQVTVRWFDGYMETFECEEVRFGSDYLWLRLTNGKNRHIPLRQVRWFGMTQESHQPDDPLPVLGESKSTYPGDPSTIWEDK